LPWHCRADTRLGGKTLRLATPRRRRWNH
jgi:hypothetical protein